ncbi:PaaI family thioesterase [Glycomyces buryatensis]|uniref:Hotdog fold thioesterase n=1 Tax=Glycomyces buryatensis TaxID=2570927 RepID=A0A4S8QBF4_9ACTN|nr:hotdog fold thioesterase [Glycomyces buryatensis]THV40145.1 hotdog fold thioesterase [Glycomyces buryatensis]
MSVFPAEVLERFSGAGVDLETLFSAGELGERMDIKVTHAEPERIVATMKVEGNRQPYGLLHGGASAVIAETLGSVGSMLHAGPGRIAVGVDLNVTHHRAVRSGTVTGVATPIHLGRSTATYEIIVSDEEDRRICTARLTCHLRDA